METRGGPSRRTLLLGSVVPLAACAPEPRDVRRGTATSPSTARSGDDQSSASPSSGAPSSSSSSSTTSDGATETVDLPDLKTLQHRWAAYTAVWVGGEFSTFGGPSAVDGDWLYEEMFGAWAWLTRFADGRAVLAGSGTPEETRSRAEERAARDAMLKGAPSWWRTGLDVLTSPTPIHFVCGYDGQTWRQVTATAGGLDDIQFVLRTEKRLVEEIVVMATTSPGDAAARRAARALITAGPQATAAQVKALGKDIRDPEAGARAAAAFAGKGRH